MRSSLTRAIRIPLALLAASVIGQSAPAEAGCGCSKAPPAPAAVRPNVTYPGTPVTLFSSSFVVGVGYTVTFTSGISGTSASVGGTVVSLRDLADGIYKPQLVVTLPTMPLGPTRITATRVGATLPEVTVADPNFTVAPVPVAVPYNYGNWQYPGFQAAVDRSGVVYISLDLSGVTSPLVYDAQLAGYPLRFSSSGVVFKNVQGFLMQLLLDSRSQPVPGMFVMPSKTTTDSDFIRYSRHEFSTYFLQHMERQPHAVDPTDGNWHVDGTRHVDHNHIILALAGKLANGTLPQPGATPVCNLLVRAYSLFYSGLTGTASVSMSGGAITDSLDTNTMQLGSRGDVFTLGTLTMKAPATINGSATAKAFSLGTGTKISGTKSTAIPTTFMAITVPAGLPSLGLISMATATTRTIYGPGSFVVSGMALSGGATLFIDNTAGPVTLYVTGAVTVKGATIKTADPKPEKFAIYVASTSSVTLNTASSFDGVVYAPGSAIAISSAGIFTGGFVGKSLTVGTYARVRYDSTLRGF